MRSLGGMGTDSEPRTRPSAELLGRLWKGKAALHAHHASLPLPEKVRLVMELQRIVLPLIARQRPLRARQTIDVCHTAYGTVGATV